MQGKADVARQALRGGGKMTKIISQSEAPNSNA